MNRTVVNSSFTDVVINIQNQCNSSAIAGSVVQLGWPQITSALATASIVQAVSFGLLVLIGCSGRFSDAMAPHAKDRGPGLWAWLRPAFFEDPEKPLSIDGRIMVRFCALGRNFSLVGSVVACFLLPLYGSLDGGELAESDFLRFTAASLSAESGAGSQRLWVVVAAMYLLVVTLCLLIRWEWQEFIALRRDHFVELARCAPHEREWSAEQQLKAHEAQSMHSVMVERLPSEVQSHTDLRAAFERVFPGGVVCCSVVQRSDRAAKRWVCLRRCRKIIPEPPPTAFVTFDSMSKRMIALQSVALFKTRQTKEHYADWDIFPAPQREDLIWQNIPRPLSKAFLVRCVFAFGFIFWSSLLLLIVGLFNPTFLQEVLPETVEKIKQNSPEVYGWITGQLPMLMIYGVQALIPKLFRWVAVTCEGQHYHSMVERSVVFRSFFYQMATYYFVAVGGATALTVWSTYIKTHPICILSILGGALPQVAVYYIVQVLNVLSALPFMQLQPEALWKALRGKQSDEPIYCDFGDQALKLALVLNFANMYSIICPLIMPVCTVFFVLAGCAFSWSLQNSYGQLVPRSRLRRSEVDLQGGLWYELFTCAMTGMLLGVGAMSGVILARLAVILQDNPDDWLNAALCVAMLLSLGALFFLMGSFWYDCSQTFVKWSEVMTYEDAAAADRAPGHAELVAGFDADYYREPPAALAARPGGAGAGAGGGVAEEETAGACEDANQVEVGV